MTACVARQRQDRSFTSLVLYFNSGLVTRFHAVREARQECGRGDHADAMSGLRDNACRFENFTACLNFTDRMRKVVAA